MIENNVDKQCSEVYNKLFMHLTHLTLIAIVLVSYLANRGQYDS